jgi:hypothetical protein
LTKTFEEKIATAREILAKASTQPKIGKGRAKSKTSAVLELRAEIAALRARQYTWMDISAMLKGTLDVGHDTIRQAMMDKKNTPKKRKPKINKPEAVEKPGKIAPKEPETQAVPRARQKRFGPPEL